MGDGWEQDCIEHRRINCDAMLLHNCSMKLVITTPCNSISAFGCQGNPYYGPLHQVHHSQKSQKYNSLQKLHFSLLNSSAKEMGTSQEFCGSIGEKWVYSHP